MNIILSLIIAGLVAYIGIEHDTREHFTGTWKKKTRSVKKLSEVI